MSQVGLLGCARIIIEKMAKVEKDEKVLILTDYNYAAKELVEYMYEDAIAIGAETALLKTTPPKGTFVSGSIPDITMQTAYASDTIFACTSSSFPINIRDQLVEKNKKFMLMHHLRNELVIRTIPINLELLQKRVKKLVHLMPKTIETRLTSLSGTDITFSLENCTFGTIYDGLVEKGEFDALPPGVVDALPVPGTGNGAIVIDGSLGGYGLVRTPIKMTVKEGKIIKVEGGPEAKWLDKNMKNALKTGDKNANHWAEFLVGLNPKAEINCYNGSLLEDERHLGGVNIGWGRDTHQGGTVEAEFHGDGMVIDVTIELDGLVFIKNGKPTKELFG